MILSFILSNPLPGAEFPKLKYVRSNVIIIVSSTSPSAIKLSIIFLADPISNHSTSFPPLPCDKYKVLYILFSSYPLGKYTPMGCIVASIASYDT